MEKIIYDNSNIAESYSGATTPLTFSFVNYIYKEVYQYFSEMMGVSSSELKENKYIFEHMVDFIGCRIYYNLTSWHKMISSFPGYRFSSEFMDKMMGVEKRTSINKDPCGFFQKYFIYLPKNIFQISKIFLTFVFLGWRIQKFNSYFDKVFLNLNSVDLNKLTLAKLKKLYKKIDNQLLSQWRVPIANDFAVMISAGLADTLFKKWLNSDNAYSYMLPVTNKPLTTLDPGKKLMQIANIIKDDQAVYKLFVNYTEEKIIEALYQNYAKHRVTLEIKLYLKEFGLRMPNELKLEAETLAENPKNLISLIKTILNSKMININNTKTEHLKNDYKDLGLFKNIFLKWLLKWAGNSIFRREDARFRRTLIFGYIRKIFIEIGKKFENEQLLTDRRDIFYLSVEEIFSIIDKKKIGLDQSNIIKQRKQKMERWQNIEMPRRFETTKSIIEIENDILKQNSQSQNNFIAELRGTVASRPNNIKKFSGTTLTLKDFDPVANFEGKILVTCQTDPGWTIIFPLLKGIIVERGGMLSHAAIVARELNIPCIVGVQRATDHLPDNEKIEIDLQSGLIKKLC